MSTRTSVITWQRHAGRAEDLAAALGGRTCHAHVAALTGSLPRTALRYVLSSLITTAHLLRHRPAAVIVTNPPVIPALIVAAYSALTGRRFVLDSHPASFGVKDDTVSRRLLPLHRRLARRAAAVMVTTQHWVDVVDSWGGTGLVVHEPPVRLEVGPRTPGDRPRVLYVGVFGGDEPVELVFAAARLLPDVDVVVTGDVGRCPPELLADRPDSLVLSGFLGPEDYRDALQAADAVLVLTTEPTSVVRAGYEAVDARRALALSDTAALREVFPLAVFAANEAPAIARAIREALALASDEDRHEQAWQLQRARWDGQLARLRTALAGRG